MGGHEGLAGLAGPEIQTPQQLNPSTNQAGSQVSRRLASPRPSETWNPGLRGKLPQTDFEGEGSPTLLLSPGVRTSFSFWPVLLLWAPRLWVGTHISSSSVGYFFFSNKGWGFLKEKRGYVRIPQETKLSDSFP